MSPSHPKSASSETPLAPLLKVDHPLVQLSSTLDWDYFEQEFASLASEVGRPSLPARLMVDCTISKRSTMKVMNLSLKSGLRILTGNSSVENRTFNMIFLVTQAV